MSIIKKKKICISIFFLVRGNDRCRGYAIYIIPQKIETIEVNKNVNFMEMFTLKQNCIRVFKEFEYIMKNNIYIYRVSQKVLTHFNRL